MACGALTASRASAAPLAPWPCSTSGARTPHGGSLVYRPGTFIGSFYRSLEWLLKWRTDLFLFESSYAASLFRTQMGRPPAMVRVVHNGVGDAEFASVALRADAADIVCVGELRPVKAIDVLIEALALLNPPSLRRRPPSDACFRSRRRAIRLRHEPAAASPPAGAPGRPRQWCWRRS
jgi:glycosyltransferase involved in cell wall biosynthesis